MLYADCARLVPFWPCSELCAGLDGDQCGDVGLYWGDAGARQVVYVRTEHESGRESETHNMKAMRVSKQVMWELDVEMSLSGDDLRIV